MQCKKCKKEMQIQDNSYEGEKRIWHICKDCKLVILERCDHLGRTYYGKQVITIIGEVRCPHCNVFGTEVVGWFGFNFASHTTCSKCGKQFIFSYGTRKSL